MKLKTLTAAMAMAGTIMFTACGGGGGGGSVATPGLTISGTAATGAAMANATVTAKCASGSGTGVTGADGGYSLGIPGATLPCIIQVAGTVGGVDLVLHSVADAGTTSADQTRAVANVTPLTEMVVAQMTGSLPIDVFETFTAGTVTPEAVKAATSTVIAALKDATGIDLSAIDPFKSELVAATPSAPTGNGYDQLLDSLGDKVPPASLTQLVGQIAVAASSTSGITPPVTLQEAMAAANAGTLANCPVALSGKYRRIGYYGRSDIWTVDFKAGTVAIDGGTAYSIATDPNKPCTFSFSTSQADFQVIMGSAGAGTYRIHDRTLNSQTVGYIFPVQTTSLSALAGSWSFLQSGYWPASQQVLSTGGQLTVAGEGTVSVCEYDNLPASTSCTAEAGTMSLAPRGDGGFDVREGSATVAVVYGYRAQNGAMTVFGTTNPAGTSSSSVEQTHLVAAKLQPLSLPAAGTTYTNYEIAFARVNNGNVADPLTEFTYQINSVTTEPKSITRTRTSDGRQDTLRLDYPLTGMSYRANGSSNGINYREFLGINLPGLGINVAVNGPSSGLVFYSLSTRRPS